MQRQNRNKSNLLCPLANGTAVNKGMSLAISCCQTPKSVCYISVNTYSASFDGTKDAAYTAKYGHPPEMKQGRGKERGKGKRKRMYGKKEGEGGNGGPLRGKGEGRKAREGTGKRKGREGTAGRFAARGWKGEGRKEREGGMGN